MTPDKTPTDSKIMREADKVGGLFDDLAIGYQSDDILKFARAVLAKWGSPVVAGEPVAWRLKDEEASRHYGKEIYVYYGKEDFQEGVDPCDFIAGIEALTTPTPTQTQAGAGAADAGADQGHGPQAPSRGLVRLELPTGDCRR